MIRREPEFKIPRKGLTVWRLYGLINTVILLIVAGIASFISYKFDGPKVIYYIAIIVVAAVAFITIWLFPKIRWNHWRYEVREHEIEIQSGPHRRLVHLGQQVEDGGLACAVRADEAGDFRSADDEVEVLDGVQAAEVDAQIAGLQHGLGIQIALGDDAVARRGHHAGSASRLLLGHALSPSFAEACALERRSLAASISMPLRSCGLLVASMTRISTMA